MADKGGEKTNALRKVEEAGIAVGLMTYQSDDGAIDGLAVAQKIDRSPDQVFKTLVTVSQDKEYFVFVLPVATELDMKKAALAAGVKRIEMLPLQEITKVTGYIRGGCSPVAMKKQFPTILAEEAMLWETIFVSAGKIGAQMELAPDDLLAVCQGKYSDIVRG